MSDMKQRFAFTVTLLLLLSSISPRFASAQDATPGAPDDHINLAAMALPTDALPDGYGLSVENYQNGQAFAESIYSTQQQVTQLLNTGLVVVYDSQYANAAGDQTIRSYIEQFGSANGATSGFKILEDESGLDPKSVTSTDQPLEGVGDGPGEVTIYNVKSQNGSEPTDGVDVTFRVENYLVGVTLDSTNGSPPAQADGITLARTLADRVHSVIAGTKISGIDPSLTLKLLQLNYIPLDEGYVSAVDSFGTVSTDELFKGYKSGYTRTSALGQGNRPFPLVTDTVSTWASEDGPLQLISGGDKFQPPLTNLAEVEIDPIAGASAVVGFQYAGPQGDGKTIDSFRILATTGSNLITIDVLGAKSEAVAQRVATDLTKVQLACVDKGNCPVIDNVDTSS
jgi:hypothetical protein